MAKNVNLNVNVNSQQFNQFVQNFNAFSTRLQNINKSFQQINQTIQNTQKQSNALLNTMRSLYQVTSSLLKPVTSITTHFLKWGTIVGGITAMLGMGGGLFGIERLASSILQKRRQVMGLGGSYGGTQASLIYGQSIFSNPGDILRNIRMGMGGNIEQLTPLLALGIPFGSKDKPEDILNKIITKMPQLLRSAGPGMELMVAKSYGIDKIFTDPMDILRMSTEEGAKEIQLKIQREQQIRKELELSPKAQKAWSDLELQFKKAASHIETIFGEKLAGLAEPIGKLSEGFEKLIQTLMDSDIIEKIIKQLTKWTNQLADYLKGDKLQKDLKQFSDEVETWLPWLKQLGDNLKTFGDILGNIVGVLQRIWGVVRFLDKVEGGVSGAFGSGAGGAGAATGALTPDSGAGYDSVTGGTSGAGRGPAQQTPSAATSRGVQSAIPPGAATPGTSISVPPTSTGIPGGTRSGSSFLPIPNQGPNIFGVTPGAPSGLGGAAGGLSFNQRVGGALNNSLAFRGGAAGQSFVGGASNVALNQRFGGGNTSVTGGSTRMAWSNAAGKAAPGGGNFGMNVNQSSRVANVDRRSQQGPLSTDNWQMTRTAKLEIRNVPGSNVFMTGAGMST